MAPVKTYEFIGFEVMDITKPFACIGFGAMDVTKPLQFIRFWGVVYYSCGGGIHPERNGLLEFTRVTQGSASELIRVLGMRWVSFRYHYRVVQ